MNDACGHMKVVGFSPCESKLRLGNKCLGAWGSPIIGGFSGMGRKGKNGCCSLIFVLLFPRKMGWTGNCNASLLCFQIKTPLGWVSTCCRALETDVEKGSL